jgi:hypothetical protein
VAPLSHFSPSGIVKSKTAAQDVPLFTTLAELQGAPVVVVPTAIVAASHVSHFSHLRLEYCAFLILLPSSESENSMKSPLAIVNFSSKSIGNICAIKIYLKN